MPKAQVRKLIDLLGRVCLSAIFVIAIPVKLTNFSGAVASLTAKGIPGPLSVILIIAAIACLLAGTICLIFGKDQKIGASLLLIFLVPTTLIFHISPFQAGAVFANLGLIGGLIISLTRHKLPEGEW